MPEVNPFTVPVVADFAPLAQQLRAAADKLDPPTPGKVTIELDEDVRNLLSYEDPDLVLDEHIDDIMAACRASWDAES